MNDQTLHILELVAAFLAALLTSSGFWIYITKRTESKSLTTQLLLGLAHDRIVYLGLIYIQRGSITRDEFENMYDCIFVPYEKMGGNGFAKKMMDDIKQLPIIEHTGGDIPG